MVQDQEYKHEIVFKRLSLFIFLLKQKQKLFYFICNA